jgi:ComF family protein
LITIGSIGKSLWTAAVDLLYVPECGGCGKGLYGAEKSVCAECLGALIPCDHADRPDDNELFLKFPGRAILTGAAAGFEFEGKIRELIHAFKYDNRPDVARRLGRHWGVSLRRQKLGSRIKLLLPMPLHPQKERERGYNQAQFLAMGLSDVLRVPVAARNALKRIRKTSQQALLSRDERWQNVSDSMRGDASLAGIEGVTLVDDVSTTGATLLAGMDALEAVGVSSVVVLALASAN